MKFSKILTLYKTIREKHGRPAGQWSLWCKRPKTIAEKEEVIIGSILTQRTNWNNVERAIGNLKKARVCSLKKIAELGKNNPRHLAKLIQPSGFYKTKMRYLYEVAEFFVKNGGVDVIAETNTLRNLREALLNLRGVGPETADSILLYALKKPVFVIDEYTRRLVKKYRLALKLTYEYLQNLFEKNLPRDYQLYQDFHALIVIEGKQL